MTRKNPVKEGESNWKRDKDNGDSDSNNFSDLDKEENPNQSWNSVTGLESTKTVLKEAMILPIKSPY